MSAVISPTSRFIDAFAAPAAPALLSVSDLRVSFGRPVPEGTVVRGVSFSLAPGRCLAIVGESGSGKSVTARSCVGLAGRHAFVAASRMDFAGRNLAQLADRDWRQIRGKDIGFVLQDALVSLDPLRPIGKEVGEGLWLHGVVRKREELTARVTELLSAVGVPEPAIKARQLPHELSGGQRQRALIASALALDPALLIADEPTTALDVTVQAQILDLLEAAKHRGKALILISHDLSVVSRMADEIIVMRHGEVVEQGPAEQVFGAPQHAYTRRLLDAIPSAHTRGARLAPGSTSRLDVRVVSTQRGKAPQTSSQQTPSQQTQTSQPQPPRVQLLPPRRLHPSAAADLATPVLSARGLSKRFRGPDGVWRTVVSDVSFDLHAGETVGIVGESGSGKSTTARMALALETPDNGEVHLHGQPWSALAERERRARRPDISVVYQDPLSSFDPRWTVERILDDSLGVDVRGALARQARVDELLDLVGLATSQRKRRPLELSGGQRQRVAIARAIAPRPTVIVCDEPVSALDVSIQAQILDLFSDLKAVLGVSYLFISHDLGVIRHVSDRVLVMKNGRVLESGPTDEVFLRPQHAYTQELVGAVPHVVTRRPTPVVSSSNVLYAV